MSQTLDHVDFAAASATIGFPLNAICGDPAGFLPSTVVSLWAWTSGATTFTALVNHGSSKGYVREQSTGMDTVSSGAWNGTTVTIQFNGGGSKVVTPA